MTAKTEFGHKWSLHEDTLKPEFGFGYPNAGDCPTIDDVESRARLWNSYTPETCPHRVDSKCQLCGKKYLVTAL